VNRMKCDCYTCRLFQATPGFLAFAVAPCLKEWRAKANVKFDPGQEPGRNEEVVPTS
jgi:hypothetical protein